MNQSGHLKITCILIIDITCILYETFPTSTKKFLTKYIYVCRAHMIFIYFNKFILIKYGMSDSIKNILYIDV